MTQRIRLRYVLVLVGILIAAGAGYALLQTQQQTSQPNEAAAQAAPVPEKSAAAAKDAKQATQPEVAWSKRCAKQKAADGKELNYCEAVHQQVTNPGGVRVVEIALGYPQGKDKPASAVFILPFGVLLEQPVTLKISEQNKQQLWIRTCLQQGCVSSLSVSETLLAELKSAKQVQLEMQNTDGRNIVIPIPMSGFAAMVGQL